MMGWSLPGSGFVIYDASLAGERESPVGFEEALPCHEQSMEMVMCMVLRAACRT